MRARSLYFSNHSCAQYGSRVADLRPSLAYGVLSARTGKTAKPACARRNAFSATEIVAFSETVMIGPSQWHRQTIYPIALPFTYAVHSSLNMRCPLRESNAYSRRNRILSPTCLPIPPNGRVCVNLSHPRCFTRKIVRFARRSNPRVYLHIEQVRLDTYVRLTRPFRL